MDFLSQQLNLVINQSAQSTLDRNWKSIGIYDHFCRIYYITAGSAKISCDNHEILLEPGFFYLIPSHRHIAYSCRSHIEINWIHIELTIRSGIALFSFIDTGIIRFKSPEISLITAFQELTVEFPSEILTTMIRWQGMVMLLLADFFATENIAIPNIALMEVKRFDGVTKLISSNPGRAWRIEELAAESGFGRVRFSTEFKRIFGIPPGRFVMLKRIERARYLLRYTDLTLEAIGAELSFYDGFHFSKTFKRVTGITPKQFRSTGNIVIP